MKEQPILAEVVRGDLVENIHRGAFALIDYRGNILACAGDIQRPLYAHSAIKPLQIIALCQSGAYEGLELGLEELALGCASHTGESIHVQGVQRWLERIGLTPDYLKCGIINPTHRATNKALIVAGQKPTPLHHPCSGKHAAFLSAAVYQGDPLENYTDRHHPVQQQVAQWVIDFMGLNPNHLHHGIDGCSTPLLGMSVFQMALGMAKTAYPVALETTTQEGIALIKQAMHTHPYLVGGEDQFCTEWMQVAGKQGLVKVGTDGVYVAMLPSLKAGLALKIDDGNYKAADVVFANLLRSLSFLSTEQEHQLSHWFHVPIKNHVGLDVGELRATLPYDALHKAAALASKAI